MTAIRDEVAKNIAFYRKRSKLKQKDVANRIGVGSTTISNWENGVSSIDIDSLFTLCGIFGISVSEIYGKVSDESKYTKEDDRLLSEYKKHPEMHYAIKKLLDIE